MVQHGSRSHALLADGRPSSECRKRAPDAPLSSGRFGRVARRRACLLASTACVTPSIVRGASGNEASVGVRLRGARIERSCGSSWFFQLAGGSVAQ